jgi:hypothetical protein
MRTDVTRDEEGDTIQTSTDPQTVARVSTPCIAVVNEIDTEYASCISGRCYERGCGWWVCQELFAVEGDRASQPPRVNRRSRRGKETCGCRSSNPLATALTAPAWGPHRARAQVDGRWRRGSGLIGQDDQEVDLTKAWESERVPCSCVRGIRISIDVSLTRPPFPNCLHAVSPHKDCSHACLMLSTKEFAFCANQGSERRVRTSFMGSCGQYKHSGLTCNGLESVLSSTTPCFICSCLRL